MTAPNATAAPNPLLLPFAGGLRVVVVTGCRTGVGRQLLLQLAAMRHVRVVCTMRDVAAEDVQDLLEQVTATAADVHFLPLELTSASSMLEFVTALRRVLQGAAVDVLVHNAGVIPKSWTASTFDLALTCNCWSPLLLTALLHHANLFRNDGASHVVHVSSFLGMLFMTPEPYRTNIKGADFHLLLTLPFLPAYDPLSTTEGVCYEWFVRCLMMRGRTV